VLVLDLGLPAKPGVQVCRELVAADPALRVLVLSASGEQADVLEAVKSGAMGCPVKSATTQNLLDAVCRTAAGDPVFTPGPAGLVLGEYRRLAAGALAAGASAGGAREAPRLTGRETEVLRLVAKGLSYRQIAERLVISHRTVQNHGARARRRLSGPHSFPAYPDVTLSSGSVVINCWTIHRN
jgi:DNA-binding NarL/FixJ family response regulator